MQICQKIRVSADQKSVSFHMRLIINRFRQYCFITVRQKSAFRVITDFGISIDIFYFSCKLMQSSLLYYLITNAYCPEQYQLPPSLSRYGAMILTLYAKSQRKPSRESMSNLLIIWKIYLILYLGNWKTLEDCKSVVIL